MTVGINSTVKSAVCSGSDTPFTHTTSQALIKVDGCKFVCLRLFFLNLKIASKQYCILQGFENGTFLSVIYSFLKNQL